MILMMKSSGNSKEDYEGFHKHEVKAIVSELKSLSLN